MRILFDQGTPVPLRGLLKRHDVSTVYELGWSQLENGKLLSRVNAQKMMSLRGSSALEIGKRR